MRPEGTDSEDREGQPSRTPEQWLDVVHKEGRARLKIYVGMSAGVGKSYRMLQEAHALQRNGVNIRIGFIETHGRKETHELLEGLEVIPRREVFYRGKRLEELDLNAVLILHPEWVVVDELAHTNVPGSRNEKRWQDVADLINAGINVITAVNIQHIESINEEVKAITGVEVKERVPDSFLQMADEVVNIDLSADDLITRLKEGKIYDKSKVGQALDNFFRPEKILQLRELALKEVAGAVERKVETVVGPDQQARHDRFLACISSNHEMSRRIIRKTARLANYYNSKWYVLYVQTGRESADRIPLDKQRHLIHNFELATELHAEVVRVKGANVARTIMEVAAEKQVTTVCIGKPHFNLFQVILRTSTFKELLKALSEKDMDIIILS